MEKPKQLAQCRIIEPKPGTKWVGKGEGAKISSFNMALFLRNKYDQLYKMAKFHLRSMADFNTVRSHLNYRTNLALTGEPLTDEDLKRIAECE